ncbi:MAG: tripartite tricarboxylate transporter TctB family protein [Alphaproteobacteria bacterium]|nr:tripartite tricarboxylate transporter TctB family protein [Alphaproteobacteria bacterium]
MGDRVSTGFGRILAIVAGLHVEIGILIFCGIVFLGTGRTEGPVFDVIGPDVLPAATAGIVALLVLLQVALQVVRTLRNPPPPVRIDPEVVRNGVIFTVATILFVTIVAQGWLPFALATSAFMTVTTMLLSNRIHWRDAVFGASIGLALGVVLQFVFTRILFIDLPG